MRLMRRLFRFCRLLPHLLRGLWLAVTRMPRNPPPRTEAQWQLVRWWHGRLLELVGIRVRIHGQACPGPVLFVANHVSWLDISALLTCIDAGFIGKRELRDWPVLGLLIRRGGTIFIERGGRGAAAAAVEEMIVRLDRGDRAAVFPEGTTSPGESVRRFHPRLFDAALRTGVPVQPVALRYSRTDLAFVDDEPFLRNLWRLLGESDMHLEVDLLPTIQPEGHDRRRLAEISHRRIADTLMRPAGAPAHGHVNPGHEPLPQERD
jgi:lyso-ornithine lipid O-acyltransferase